MCGIAGIFSIHDNKKAWPSGSLATMLDRLAHRGPDDRGMYVDPGIFMGHTRLAVLDLSPAGHQPMSTENNGYVISFNGEIYNFKDIRGDLEKKGYRFRSHSDTEVLLYAWQEWGESSIERLDGIFAFALYDRKERALFLVRDHLGIKPLFYTIHHDQLFFASEPMALFSPMNPCPNVNTADLDVYFTFNYLPAPRTGLEGVYQLAAGSLLRVDDHGEKVRCYWKPVYAAHTERRSSDQVDRFEELLTASVKTQLVSDAPLGLFLSGGLDSFAVALSAVESGHHPLAFTLGFSDAHFNEVPAASSYAKHLHITDEASTFSWSENDIHETLGVMRELLADASCFPMYQLSKFARKKVTVALSGDGGDELLAGYDTYKAGALTPFVRALPSPLRRSFRAFVGHLPSDKRRYGLRMVAERLLDAAEEGTGRDHASFRRIFSPRVKKFLYTPDLFCEVEKRDPVGEYAGLMHEVPAGRSYLTARQHADLLFHLPSILAKVDRMSMANGLEVRVPLLNRQLVDFCLDLPDNAKRHLGKGKRILRDSISQRAPKGSLSRAKAGFLPPIDQWFRGTGPMNSVFGDHLAVARSTLPFLQWNAVEDLWQDHKLRKREAGYILLGILQYINWSVQCRKCS